VDAAAERPASRIFGRRRQPPAQPDSHAALQDALAAERHARQAAERTAAEERARAQRAEAVLAEELRSTVGKTEELIARIDGYEHNRVSFEVELDAVRRTHSDLLAEAEDEHRAALRSIRDQLHEAQRELDAANHHIDTLNEAHTLELGGARSQRDTAERQKSALEEQLAASRAESEALRARLEDRDGVIERARAEAAQASAESEELHHAVARLRDAIAARARDAATAGKRFIRDPDALDRSREELRRDAERIAALERQAEALREAIHSQLPYSLHASPLQEALPLPDGE
jgi:DNA repair exonuclease SbcCD ATPase subunit